MNGWNPWKLVAIAMALVVTTALVTGLVVANLSSRSEESVAVNAAPAPTRPAARSEAPAPRVAAPAPARPTQAAIQACNEVAAQASTRDKTLEVVKDGAIGAAVGAAVGAAGGAIADGGSGAGKGAAIGGIIGAGGGTLYGLNENKKNDERSREAYARCMRDRGFTG